MEYQEQFGYCYDRQTLHLVDHIYHRHILRPHQNIP
jgi:hypothetical protein